MIVRVSARKLLMSGLAGTVVVLGGVGAAAWAGGQGNPPCPAVISASDVPTHTGQLVQSAPAPVADRWVPQAVVPVMPCSPKPESCLGVVVPASGAQPPAPVVERCAETGPSSGPMPAISYTGPGQPTVSPLPPLSIPTTAFVAQPPAEEKAPAKTPVCMVNSRRIRLNYEIREVGPSGVSRVELWATRDGKNWQRYFDERPSPGPLLVHVAEEGRYGFTILVKSGVGHCIKAPKTGDEPQIWIEVDETKPVVQLADVKVGKDAEAGLLRVAWSSSDANLRPQAYTLSYALTKAGPWTPIVSDLDKDQTNYTWHMPKDVPYRFLVRVEASDKAGNVGTAMTAEAVTVDHAKPRGVILGVDVEPMQK